MSYTNGLDNPELYFQTLLYTGNGSNPRTLTGLNFQPDWVWLKNRTSNNGHTLADAVRGANKTISSDGNGSELTDKSDGHLDAFTSDGFIVGAGSGGDARVNDGSHTYVAWNWKAGGSASSNSDGSITTSVSVNTTAGFSIVSYTGTFANATVGHGLGVAPKVIILKNRDTSNNWCVGHGSLGFDKFLPLNDTDAAGTDSSFRFQGTSPTSTVFSVGAAGETNGSSQDMIAYCLAEKQGYSKFGKYTGNGSSDGTFIYTGFKPAWVMTKSMDTTSNWEIKDNTRSTFNPIDDYIKANAAAAEDTGVSSHAMDFLSNGFKHRGSNDEVNGSETYIYMAFAESPFVNSNGVPNNAR